MNLPEHQELQFRRCHDGSRASRVDGPNKSVSIHETRDGEYLVFGYGGSRQIASFDALEQLLAWLRKEVLETEDAA